jgi:hypothetical protein
MKKFLLLAALIASYSASAQLIRGPVTYSPFSASLLTNLTDVAWLNALGLASGTNQTYNTDQFTLTGSQVNLKALARATNPIVKGAFLTDFLSFTSAIVRVDSTFVITNADGQQWNFNTSSNANTIARRSDLTNVIQALGVAGAGTVTSVGLSMPSVLFNNPVAGSPVTTSGVLAPALGNQSVNTIFAGPASGSPAAPTFRAIASSDLPPNTNIYGASLSVTNWTAIGTNYVAANFAPISGYIKLVSSNNVLYAVSDTKTNLISDLR